MPSWWQLEGRCRRQPALLSELLDVAAPDCRPALYDRWSRLFPERPAPPGPADQLAALLREPEAAPVTRLRQVSRNRHRLQFITEERQRNLTW